MSLLATRLQNWRIQNPELDRNMTRPCEYGALDFFIQQTDAPNSIISPNLRDRAFASIGNTVQVPVINYDGDVTVANVRSCTIADAENTSALYTVVWKTYSVGFTMVPTLYMNNEISYDHDFARKMEKICRALATALDVDAVAALEAQKTQVFKDLLQYQATANVIDVPNVDVPKDTPIIIPPPVQEEDPDPTPTEPAEQPKEEPAEPEEVIEVEEEEPPLADIEEPDVPLAEMEEEEVPLTDVPKTGDSSNTMLWMMMALLSAAALAGIRIAERKER